MVQGKQVGRGFSISMMNANPTIGLQLTPTTGGTLPLTTYYFKYTFVNASGQESGTSNEQNITLSGSNTQINVNLGSQYWPAWAVALNIYVSTISGAQSFQYQITTKGATFNMQSLLTTGSPSPQWNLTSYIDVNPSALGLPTGSEFIIHNIYYNNPVAFGIWDNANSIQTMFDGDIGNGARMGVAIHVTDNQWLRIYNGSASGSVQVAIDGVQTQ